MGKVIVQASMSLDGFIADTNDQVGPLFDWFDNGDVEFSGSDPSMVFHISRASADYLRTAWSNIAVHVIGRRLFDLTNGWNGRPAVGEAVFVVTHSMIAVTESTIVRSSAVDNASRNRSSAVSSGNLANRARPASLTMTAPRPSVQRFATTITSNSPAAAVR
jgi:dihydrofolate reductase